MMPMAALETHAMPIHAYGVSVGQPVKCEVIFAAAMPSAMPNIPPIALKVTASIKN